MSLTDRIWDAFTAIIRMQGDVRQMRDAMVSQQTKIEHLTERVVRLETALEIALAASGRRSALPDK